MTRERLTRRTVLKGAAAAAALGAVAPDALAEEPKARTIERAPAGFVGHGSPMLALDAKKGGELSKWTAAFSKPVAVLVVSAHFQKSPITVGAVTKRPLVYDFSNFPKRLYRLTYDAPPAPKLGKRVADVLKPLGAVRSDPRRGHDHGTWVPLRWMYADADVPVLSLSLPSHDPKQLWRIGRALRPLRDEGVFVLGSGNVTHNLRKLGRAGSKTPAWAADFDAWCEQRLVRNDKDALLDWQRKAPAARTNHPTVEHFVPLLIAAGARYEGERATFPVEGFEAASVSRRCVQFGA